MTRPAPASLRPLSEDAVAREAAKLPKLPDEIAYLDDYSGERRVIAAPAIHDVWQLRIHGASARLDFAHFHPGDRQLLKHWAYWLLSWVSPVTLRSYFWRNRRLARSLGAGTFSACLGLEPMRLQTVWHTELLPRVRWQHELVGLKSFLRFACSMALGHLRPEHLDFVGAFRLGVHDKYASVRGGLVFLTMNEEASIVDHLDDLNGRVKAGERGQPEELRDACVLLLSYQYGFRRTQVARVRVQDVKVYEVADADGPSVHVTFETLKQRWSARRHAMVRAIKREWAFMFTAFLAHRRSRPHDYDGANVVPGSLFGLSPADIAETIARVTAAVTGVRRTANELRHTAAQRLVDAGASREELAEFMGHTSLDTGLVYFEASPTQAVLINKAMAVSPIYSAIVEVARTRTIDKTALLGIPPDRQIGGSPHGIPIAGIGACELGQSLCAKNPVLSCYGCRKFLPVADVAAHREVLDGLRPVVRQFYDASRGELQSPAYTQLARTLAAVQQVMKAVESDRGGDPA